MSHPDTNEPNSVVTEDEDLSQEAPVDNPASDESEDEQNASDLQKDPFHRRQQHNAKFQALLSRRAEVGAHSPPTANLPKAELPLSLLVGSNNGQSGALDPREYQIELFERAKVQNTIAVLDTGSGKTLIAVLLLRHTIEDELIKRAQGEPPRISFFLVENVTLAYQQASVLRNNLDQKVAHFFGAMGVDFWDKQTWTEHFQNNMVIVCTADILYHCLMNGFIGMKQINLLIFDEAHHAKKDHVYARIIRDSYHPEPPSSRPRIFGMTASPIDTKGDVVEAAQTLETLLDSKIATTSKLNILRQVVNRPKEEVWIYSQLKPPFATELYKVMENRFGRIRQLEPIFRFSREASSALGKWCADCVWSSALADAVLPKLEGSIFRQTAQSSGNTDEGVAQIKAASEVAKTHELNDPKSPGELSPKVQLLWGRLSQYFGPQAETKCIIFTEKRYTAKTLFELFTNLQVPFLRPGILIGVRSGDKIGMNVTFRQQILTLVKFRTGELNCLFATSVAEEGLDIPDCNLVIRFDLYNTLIQYVQSRGRARHANSTFANMVEQGNASHEIRLREVQDAEKVMQSFCQALPEDRILRGNDSDFDPRLQGDWQQPHSMPSTVAKLTFHSAITVLARYASSLQHENDVFAQAIYVVLPMNDAFICEVILPEKSPIRGATGMPATRKSIAKQSAAFETCRLLRKHKLLDDYLNSVYHRRLPAMRNAKLAITSKSKSKYAMLPKPSFWHKQQGQVPQSFYVTIISFKPLAKLTRDHDNLILLTREKLPCLPPFPVFLEVDVETTVLTVPVEEELQLSAEEMESLTTFTFRVFRDVFQKTYEREPEKLSYWLAPGCSINESNPLRPRSLLNWSILQKVQENDDLAFQEMSLPEMLINRFVFDVWDGSRRYFTLAINKTLQPSSPPPSYVPRRRYMESIMDYSTSLSRNARGRVLPRCNWNQPVVEAELVRLRRNLLDRMTDDDKQEPTKCMICIELLKISAIPVPTAASCLAFPAIMSRIDSYLIALEGCELLSLSIRPDLALEAFTKDSDNTEEHRAQQIHTQRGMGKNYERLEFLGDCFLKMATSISLFNQHPDDNEYDYHVNRMCLICNKNLYKSAKKQELYQFIRSKGFSRHTWYPEGLTLLQGRDHSKKTSREHDLGEKTIADVCEALIGASVLSGAPGHRFDMAVKAVTALVDSPSHNASCWEDYESLYSIPIYQKQTPEGFEIDLCRQVEGKLGYKFKYPRLLHSAFTHPSYPAAWARVPCYQRLEFLGDSLLDMVCVEDLFQRFPDRDPQWLTEHKMAMVSNKFLGALCVKLELHTHLRYFGGVLQSQITHYAEEIQTAAGQSEGAMDYWTTTRDPPKCLPDMVEAYLGAVFVDSNFSFDEIEAFFQRHIKPYFQDMAVYDTFANKHPTTFLHNKLTNEYGCTNYCLKAAELPAIDGEPPTVLAAVIVHDTVLAEGTASSGRYAKVKASEKALTQLVDVDRREFRDKYHCDCGSGDQMPGELDAGDIGTAI